ncbi:MAG: zinc-dependent alcohol dehydrogenase family protein [Planctomycetes bacterium]|nr:zinc-dependent alcohol dehydrogenase family protein [Planctomycetota bacterium]
MKAVVLKKYSAIEQKPLEIVDLPIPTPADNQILVKVSVCGACHTDLDEAEGRLIPTKLPIVPGHQIVGTVADKGNSVTKFNINDRIGITWLYSACGTCSFCKTGNENLCENAKWTGKDVDGGYAEYMVVSENFAYRLPETFSDSQAAPLLCAGVIGYRTLKLADITDGQTIGLFGFGASAHIVIQIIKHKFPTSPVFVFTKTQEHAKLAETLGADWTGRSGDIPPEKLNKAMDFTPVGECTRDALAVLDRGGRLVINAIRKETPIPELNYAEHLWLEREIKSVANVTRKDAEEFLPLAAQIPIKPTVEQFPLEQANDVLLAIKHSKLRAAAVFTINK